MNKLPAHTEFNPDGIFHYLEERAEAMTTAEADAESLEEHKKPLLAKLTLEYMGEDKKRSRVEAEQMALASDEYCTHIDGLIEAKQKANRAKAAYHNARKWADLKQTLESSARSLVSR